MCVHFQPKKNLIRDSKGFKFDDLELVLNTVNYNDIKSHPYTEYVYYIIDVMRYSVGNMNHGLKQVCEQKKVKASKWKKQRGSQRRRGTNKGYEEAGGIDPDATNVC